MAIYYLALTISFICTTLAFSLLFLRLELTSGIEIKESNPKITNTASNSTNENPFLILSPTLNYTTKKKINIFIFKIIRNKI